MEECRGPNLAEIKDWRYPLVRGGLLPWLALDEDQGESGLISDSPLHDHFRYTGAAAGGLEPIGPRDQAVGQVAAVAPAGYCQAFRVGDPLFTIASTPFRMSSTSMSFSRPTNSVRNRSPYPVEPR